MTVGNSEASVGSATTLSTSFGGASVAWRFDGAYAIITSGNNLIYNYDGANFNSVSVKLSGSINDAEWRPPSDTYALLVGMDTGTNYASVYRYDGSTCTKVTSGYQVWGNPNNGISWKPDGSYALIANALGYLLKYDPIVDSVSLVADTHGWSLWDVEWNPDGSYAICVGQGVYKYTESSFVALEASGLAGVYRGISFKSNGTGAILVTYGGEFRYCDGLTVSPLANAGYELWKVHYRPSSDLAIAVGVNNGHICELDGTNVYDLSTDASSVGLRGLDWRFDGTYALASYSTYTIKYVPSGGLIGSVVFDKWGYGTTEMAIITVTATSGGVPVPGVSVAMSSSIGGSFNPLYGLTDSNGICMVNYIPSAVLTRTTATISASLSKSGYSPGSGSNTTVIVPSIYVMMTVTPSTINLGENAVAYVHASIYGNPGTPVPDADVWIGGGYGSWTPSMGLTDSNGDFTAVYSTHHYVAGLEVMSAIVSKKDYASGSGWWNLTTLVPPMAVPTLISPPEGFVTNVLPTFEWDVVWGAVSYDVFVGLKSTISESDFYWRTFHYSGDFTNLTMNVPLPDGKYYWAVRASNSTGVWSQFSSPRSFTLMNGGIPGAPALHSVTSPDDDGTYSLDWDSGSDDIYVKEYLVQESQSPLFTDPWEFHINATSLSIRNRPNGVYYYRALTIDSDGQRSLWSEVVSVEVRRVQSESISLSLTPSSIAVGTGSVAISGAVGPMPSERRDVKISILDPSGHQSPVLVKTESFNFAAYGYAYYPTIAGTYYIVAQLLSTTGEVTASTQPMSFIAFSGSGLTLFVDKRSVVVDSSVMIWGDLNPSRVGAYVNVTVTDPNGVQSTDQIGISSCGYRLCKILNAVGTWSISTKWPGDALLPSCVVGPISIDVIGVPKLAVLIAGMNDINSGFDKDIVRQTNLAYDVLLRHGYAKDQIMYLAYTKQIDADKNGLFDDVDLATSWTNITYALTTFAKEKLDSSSDFLLYFIDHGLPGDIYFWDNDIGMSVGIQNTTLALMLNNIACRYKVVILDSCYGGSFIDRLSAAGSIIITSVQGDRESKPIGISQWDLGPIIWTFSGELFNRLDSGISYLNAFVAASNCVISSGLHSGWGIEPQLDDNGDGVASTVWSWGLDGDLSSQVSLDYAPDSIIAVQNTCAQSATLRDRSLPRVAASSFVASQANLNGLDENTTAVLGDNVTITVPIEEERATNVTACVVSEDMPVISDPLTNVEYVHGEPIPMQRAEGLNFTAVLNNTILNATGNYTIAILWSGLDGSGGVLMFINLTIGALGVPQNLNVRAGDQYANLTWDTVPEAEQYDVYRFNDTSGEFELIGTTNTNWYNDTGLAPGIYTYEVRAVHGGIESGPSLSVSTVVTIPEFNSLTLVAISLLVLLGAIARGRRTEANGTLPGCSARRKVH
jgi:hypothetical protein